MNKYFKFSYGLIILFFISCSAPVGKRTSGAKQPVDHVNPYMGNISYLLVPTFPIIHLSNSLLRVYPERQDYTEIVLKGLPLIVTSHRGSSAFNLSPFHGDESDLKPVIKFSYDQEIVTPYSYSVYLDGPQIQIDFGLSHQSAVYGISFIDETQVYENMEREVAGKTVADLQLAGRNIWNEALGKIKIEGGTADEQTVFYTSLYRCFERPVCISEDGRYYSVFDGTVHEDHGRPFYTDDWIWDSYRAHHPLRILIDSEKEEDILHSFVLMAEQMDDFWMPTFPEISGDSRRMNSNHGVASVIDAYRKGLRNFNLDKAYEASKRAITEKTLAPWSGKPAGELDRFYKENGYDSTYTVNNIEFFRRVSINRGKF